MKEALTGDTQRRDHDPATIFAIGAVVYVIAKVVHEGIGHGLVCELAGGDLRGVSSSWCDCDKAQVTTWGNRAIKAAGTFCNLLAGAACLAALKRPSTSRGALYYLLWMSAAVHLFMAGGYMMVDPILRFGDWGQFIEGLENAMFWRFAIVAVGISISVGGFFLLRPSFEILLGGHGRSRKYQARLLCWLPYFAVGGLLMSGAALLNSLGPRYAVTSSLATIGGTFLLVWIPVAVDDEAPRAGSNRLIVERSRGWLIAGATAVIFLIGLFGPGISL